MRDKKEAIEILSQALNKASKAGVFSLDEAKMVISAFDFIIIEEQKEKENENIS
ncbi:MAG TPA: hypothetical protein VJ892_00915 [Candidatus Absconditabacterales bacterium]|nr:hypothetical protein [Candidatus Absconditabacterales bacterium]